MKRRSPAVVLSLVMTVLALGLPAGTRPAGAQFTGGVFVAVGSVFGDATPEIVTGAGPGGGPHVRVFSGNVPSAVSFFAYNAGFTGGVRVAACDLDDDGRAEIITGPGPGGGPHVRVWKVADDLVTVSELFGFFAYNAGFTGGVWVACADLDGAPGGRAEIVTGAGEGGGPHVRIWKVTGDGPFTLSSPFGFFAYLPSFTGGVRVAAFNGFGGPQIVTAPGPGNATFVATREVLLTAGVITGVSVLKAFNPYGGFQGGIFVAAAHGSVDSIITGAGAGGGPHVRAFEPQGIFDPIDRGSFYAYDPGFTGGVAVAFHPALGVVTGAGPGGGPHVRSHTENGMPLSVSFYAY